jgi:hypothetical protein
MHYQAPQPPGSHSSLPFSPSQISTSGLSWAVAHPVYMSVGESHLSPSGVSSVHLASASSLGLLPKSVSSHDLYFTVEDMLSQKGLEVHACSQDQLFSLSFFLFLAVQGLYLGPLCQPLFAQAGFEPRILLISAS